MKLFIIGIIYFGIFNCQENVIKKYAMSRTYLLTPMDHNYEEIIEVEVWRCRRWW
jgi:hypothetical protein